LWVLGIGFVCDFENELSCCDLELVWLGCDVELVAGFDEIL